jgi:hypothetical protein
MLKLSDIILESIDEGEIFLYREEIEKIKDITSALHTNIRNWNKEDRLQKLWNDIDRLMRPKTIITGVPVDSFSLYEVEHPELKTEEKQKKRETNKGSVKIKEVEL